ncbi:hypothetical protein ACTDI4_13025 [Mesorhizobium sp. PUT5]|uniref:hypothetical protein n=1 Tax=Mesorhizobium sp. PUT5 TaxID=3454629 RepID=UPI003FA4520E
MTGKANPPGAKEEAPKGDRRARLAAELRANLARRKAQTRSRRGGEGDTRPEGIGMSGEGTSGEDGAQES